MMKRFPFFTALFCFFLLTGCQSFSQNPAIRFEKEIREFARLDSMVMPPPGKIQMVGSSSFTMWRDVNHYLPGYPLINRGFGGSTLADVIYYFDEVVAPYKPAQVLIYCGENDIAAGAKADTVVQRFKRLFHMIRKIDENIQITYVSMKPSPSRAAMMMAMHQGNAMIKSWLSTQPGTAFVDVYSKMLDAGGQPRPDIFLEDMLHMNGRGYEIWARAIAPHLLTN